MTKKCEHENIMFDKINDYSFCSDCHFIFEEDYVLIEKEDKTKVVSEEENNLKELNNLYR